MAAKKAKTIKTDNKQTTNNSLYGFNSVNPVSSSKSELVGQQENNEQTKTITNEGKDVRVLSGTQKIEDKGNEVFKKEGSVENEKSGYLEFSKFGFDITDHKGTQKLEKKGTETTDTTGNIGVTTSQQMLESEIALWKWNFLESIFNNLDSVLTLAIY